MRKFDWSEAKKFWETRDAYWASSDHHEDPDALQNVLCAGDPLWFNRRWACYQERAYRKLFDLLPPPGPGAKALDVGCGSGRWSRLLAGRGYRTVGIDLQPNLIEENRRRYPNIEFLRAPVQDYTSAEPFDLVSSVVVVHINPYEEQLAMIRKIRDLLKSGGHVIMLEGIKESHEPFNFPRAMDGWIRTFEGLGFRTVAFQYYNYNPFFRTGVRLSSRLKGGRPRTNDQNLEEWAKMATKSGGKEPRGRSPLELARRLVFEFDGAAEPVLARANAPLTSSHCGFLFRAI